MSVMCAGATLIIFMVSSIESDLVSKNTFDYNRFKKVPIAVAVGLNVLIILFCSIKVQVTAYRQRRAINAQAATVQLQQEEQEEQERRLKEYKRAFTMGLLVIASILLYCPYIINAILLANNGVDRSSLILNSYCSL
ncbi:hypothetical protein AC249_AIPGENE28652 [Exaiptasia diaphana]|nr:hypothetical protein AC249_AIPGENE28652 [Exaiptasia diaphana]